MRKCRSTQVTSNQPIKKKKENTEVTSKAPQMVPIFDKSSQSIRYDTHLTPLLHPYRIYKCLSSSLLFMPTKIKIKKKERKEKKKKKHYTERHMHRAPCCYLCLRKIRELIDVNPPLPFTTHAVILSFSTGITVEIPWIYIFS